jgi:hypothetical protein
MKPIRRGLSCNPCEPIIEGLLRRDVLHRLAKAAFGYCLGVGVQAQGIKIKG